MKKKGAESKKAPRSGSEGEHKSVRERQPRTAAGPLAVKR